MVTTLCENSETQREGQLACRSNGAELKRATHFVRRRRRPERIQRQRLALVRAAKAQRHALLLLDRRNDGCAKQPPTVAHFHSLAVLLAALVVCLGAAWKFVRVDANDGPQDTVLLHRRRSRGDARLGLGALGLALGHAPGRLGRHLDRGSDRLAHRVGGWYGNGHRPPEKKKWISIGVMGSAAPVSGVRPALADEH